MKEQKFIYETNVLREVEEPSIEKIQENGQTVEIKRIVKTSKPIKLAILKPDRKLFRAAEIFFAKSLSDYLQAGLLPYSLVAKRYANDGGPMTNTEQQRLETLKKKAIALQAEFYGMPSTNTEETKKRNAVLMELNSVNTEAGNIQNAYSDIYDSTAEMKSRNDTIEWWIVHLSLKDEGKGYEPIYPGTKYEERIESLENNEDTAIPYLIESMKKLSFLISFWFTARHTIQQQDFEAMDKLYTETMTEYKITSVSEEVKVTETTPAPENKAT